MPDRIDTAMEAMDPTGRLRPDGGVPRHADQILELADRDHSVLTSRQIAEPHRS